jgi:hypothetical protein
VVVDAASKACATCRLDLPSHRFSPCRSGLQSSCKSCRNLAARLHASEVTVTEKRCRSCEHVLSAACFNRSKLRADGLQGECKTCTSKRKRECDYPVTLQSKQCSSCGLTLAADAFPRDRKRAGGLRAECRICASVSNRAGIYKIPATAVRELLRRSSCEICSTPFSDRRNQHIDHCHSTGAVRGVLCLSCNKMLGAARDNEKFLRAAIEYLSKSRVGKSCG